MKEVGAVLVVTLAFLAGSATAAPCQAFRADQELGNWMAVYYRHPEPQRLVTAFQYFVESPGAAQVQTRVPVSQFFAAAMDTNSTLLRQLFDAARSTGSSDARLFALRVLWLSGCESARRLLQSAPEAWTDSTLSPVVAALAAEEPPDLLRSTPGTASDLDMLWATFFATGASRPVEQIVSVLESAETGRGMQMLVGRAAQWSLTSNAIQHPRVLAILRDLQPRATGTLARLLAGVISAAEQLLPRGGT